MPTDPADRADDDLSVRLVWPDTERPTVGAGRRAAPAEQLDEDAAGSGGAGEAAAIRVELASLRRAVADVGDEVRLRELQATIDELRREVLALRRRVGLRAEATVTLDESQLASLAEAVAARLSVQPAATSARRRARRE